MRTGLWCRRVLPLAAVVLVVLGMAGSGAAVPTAERHPGLPASEVLAAAQQASARVIVVLADQAPATPASSTKIADRIRAEAAVDGGVESQVRHAGGRIDRRYQVLNAFAATVSASERAALQHSRAVREVVPDAIVQLPGPIDASRTYGTGAPRAVDASSPAGACPTDPHKPLLEPEALQTTHTAFGDPRIPQAQDQVKGTGVRVAFLADGLDVNNPDFIRPNGSHVFIDYKDFSGDGPTAVTAGAEAFGDASSIAAQGREVYDISQFVNPAHPLRAGCNITVRGVAPGASLIGIKVFGVANSTYSSVILQGLDYALAHDHADVISESFGSYTIPDSAQDLIRQFNHQAVAAGATVVESSGDSGVQSSPSSAASDPSVIAAGASTTFRNYAQGTQYGFQFAKGWLSNNISSIESAGFTQGGRVLDLVAPGEANWALCSPDTATYVECTNFANKPTPLQSFGGTSESAPLIAGGAALVIQGYRQTHRGRTPSPVLVRQLLTSTATDLGFPSVEEGAGELNTLAAVQAAESVARPGEHPRAEGDGLLVGPTQLDISGPAGQTSYSTVKVTNVGAVKQVIHGHVRTITSWLSNQRGSVTLGSSSPTFVDQFGSARPYERIQFRVPAGADRLVAFDAWPGPNARVGLALIDPHGRFAAYTRPQGNGNHGEVDVHAPAAGTWTGLIFLRDGTFTGPVQWQIATQQFGPAGLVSPRTLTLAPGHSGILHVGLTLPGQAGDWSRDLELHRSSGGSTIVPVLLRSLVTLRGSGGTFAGNLTGGNGRDGAGLPGQISTFEFDVPAGKPELSASLAFSRDPGTQVTTSLVDPSGSEVTGGANAHLDPAGKMTFTEGVQVYVPAPRPGRWRLVIDLVNPVGGRVLSDRYRGRITFAAPPLHVRGLPDASSTVLPAGRPATAIVSVTNDGVGTQDVFLDPRTPTREALSLLSLAPDTGITIPIPIASAPPTYLVPTETNSIDAAAVASEPVTFDFGFGDPDLPAVSSGNTAVASFSTDEVTPGVWGLFPDPVGPFRAPAATGTASMGLVAQTLGFDDAASPSTGDVWAGSVDPHAAPFNPVVIAPGQSENMTLTITPTAKPGTVVHGTLYVDYFSNAIGVGGELVPIPYEYIVG